MALFGFRVRNFARDQRTDNERLQQLCRLLEDFRSGIERERDGLRSRYDSVVANAAFSQQALEDDRGDADISSRIDDMTETIIRYNERIATLERQIAFVADLENQSTTFFEKGGETEELR
jgi:hypothetical protein